MSGAFPAFVHRRYRGIFSLVAALLFLVPAQAVEPAPTAPLPLKANYVYTVWQPAKDFKRISEYFTGRENTGGDIILRSTGAVRDGMYFRIRFPMGTTFPDGTNAVIEYLRNDNPEIQNHTFTLPAMPDGFFAEVRLGLTGQDWANKDLKLVAWRFTLTAPDGELLAQEQSFLWAMPREIVERAKQEKSATNGTSASK